MTTPSLKDLIQDKHKEAENHRFTQYLFNSEISTHVYVDYLLNQSCIYSALERRAQQLGVLEGIEDIKRFDRLRSDLTQLENTPGWSGNCQLYKPSINYISYVESLTDPDAVMAHIYVRHFGDMFGGAMLKSKVPGAGLLYDFDNKNELIEKVRAKLTPEMADEANKVFQYAIDLFEELANEHDIQATG